MSNDEQERIAVEIELEIRKTKKLIACLDHRLAAYREALQEVVAVLSGVRTATTPKRTGTSERTLLVVEGSIRREVTLPKVGEIAGILKEREDAQSELEQSKPVNP